MGRYTPCIYWLGWLVSLLLWRYSEARDLLWGGWGRKHRLRIGNVLFARSGVNSYNKDNFD